MAKLEDIIAQLQSQLPRYTDDFNDINNVVSGVNNAKVITLTLEDDNVNDSPVNVMNVFAMLEADSVSSTSAADQWQINFIDKHDQTLSEYEIAGGVKKYVTFVGDFADTCELISADTSYAITIDSSVEPTGTFYLLEGRSYSGRKDVIWLSENQLTYDVDYNFQPYTEGATVQSNIRIDGVSSDADIANLLENKTIKLTKNTIFVVMNDTRASKGRFTYSDALNRREYKDDLAVETTQTFSLFVVIPTHTTTTPREAINYIHTLRPYLVKCLHGALFDSGFLGDVKFLCTYCSDSGEQYNRAYYVHRFDFENVFNIESEDGLEIQDTRAFREFEVGFKLEYDNFEEVKKTIEGDTD